MLTGLTADQYLCMHLCMATKTISVDLDAYERLNRARLKANESFSQVIKRATWESPPSTAAALLEAFESAPPLDDSVLDYLESAQAADASAPPPDSWNE